MLLNLSNHPLASWGAPQLHEAENQYGEVFDIPFPVIPPMADEAEIAVLADEYLDKCKNLLLDKTGPKNAVHLMGEFTFCFALAQKLLSCQIECVASTSERIVEQSDNTKKVTFIFKRFRNYTLCR
jgi:hypothetical protein